MHTRIFVNIRHICYGYCCTDRYDVTVPSVPRHGGCEENISKFCPVLFPGDVLPIWFTRTCIDTHVTHLIPYNTVLLMGTSSYSSLKPQFFINYIMIATWLCLCLFHNDLKMWTILLWQKVFVTFVTKKFFSSPEGGHLIGRTLYSEMPKEYSLNIKSLIKQKHFQLYKILK